MYPERKGFQDFIYLQWWSDWCILLHSFSKIKSSPLWWLVSQEFFQVKLYVIKNSQCQLFDWLSLDWSLCYWNSIHCYRFNWRIGSLGCYCRSIHRSVCSERRSSSYGHGSSFCHNRYHSTIFPKRNFQR